jgi:anti-sigma regulatory factor (Ser/Thr protein kinase)
MGQAWPLGTFLLLGCSPGAVSCARLHAKAVLAEWRLAGLVDVTELVVSELMTNAVTVSRQMPDRPPVRLDLRSDGTRVLVAVGDASPRPPVRLDAAGEDEGGRGLMLVGELADQWGWTPDGPGKVVWCVLS